MAGTEAEVKHLPEFEISKDETDEGIRSLLQILRPEWKWENVQKKILQGGYINSMTHVFLPSLPAAEGLVFRVFGSFGDVDIGLMDREKEIIGLQLAAKAGCGAPVYCVFKNGMVLGFLEGRGLTLEDFTNPDISRVIAKAIAQIHVMDPADIKTFSGKPAPFDINKDLEILFDKFIDAVTNQPESLPNPEDNQRLKEANMLSRKEILKEWELLKDTIFSMNFPRTFSHNDAHGRNMIYNEKEKRVYLVDFEMVSYGLQCNDVCYVYGTAEYWPMFFGEVEQKVMDALQSTEVQEGFVRSYLDAMAELQGTSWNEEDVTDMMLQIGMYNVLTDFSMMLFGPLMTLANNGLDGVKAAILGKRRYFAQKEKLFQLAKDYKEFEKNRKK